MLAASAARVVEAAGEVAAAEILAKLVFDVPRGEYRVGVSMIDTLLITGASGL